MQDLLSLLMRLLDATPNVPYDSMMTSAADHIGDVHTGVRPNTVTRSQAAISITGLLRLRCLRHCKLS